MDVSNIMSTIKKATAFDIFLISFFILPFIFKAWIEVFTKIGWDSLQIFWSLVVLFVFYVFVVIILVVDNRNKKRKEIAKDLIVGYLVGKGIPRISFNKVRKEFNPKYTDEFLESLLQEYPREIRRVKLKCGGFAIGRVIDETTDGEEV